MTCRLSTKKPDLLNYLQLWLKSFGTERLNITYNFDSRNSIKQSSHVYKAWMETYKCTNHIYTCINKHLDQCTWLCANVQKHATISREIEIDKMKSCLFTNWRLICLVYTWKEKKAVVQAIVGVTLKFLERLCSALNKWTQYLINHLHFQTHDNHFLKRSRYETVTQRTI
jgi:hypothetical protein